MQLFKLHVLGSAEHFGFQKFKWEGHFALHGTGLCTAQMTVETWLAGFELMQLKSTSEPLTQLCCQLRSHQGITKGWVKGSTSQTPPWEVVTVETASGVRWVTCLGIWFWLGKPDLQVLCDSPAEFQVAVHFFCIYCDVGVITVKPHLWNHRALSWREAERSCHSFSHICAHWSNQKFVRGPAHVVIILYSPLSSMIHISYTRLSPHDVHSVLL